MRKTPCVIFTILLFWLIPSIVNSQEVEDAAKAAQNPLANVISMPLQNNNDFGIGNYDKSAHVLNIQPILPVKMGKSEWLLINRFIIPIPKSFPNLSSENAKSQTGIGDITYTAWFSPPAKGNLIWGVGPITIWPTANDEILGQGKFSIGPSLVLVYPAKKFMAAAIVSNWVSVGGDSARSDVNTFYFQYIFTYFLQKKWYLSTAPIILANWEAEKDQKWTVPLGGGFGKMFNLGKLPMDFQTQAFYNVVKPDASPDWQLRFQLKLIFPTGKK